MIRRQQCGDLPSIRSTSSPPTPPPPIRRFARRAGRRAALGHAAGGRAAEMRTAHPAGGHGHAHPRILPALPARATRLAVPSRAYYNDRLGAFLEELCKLTGLDAALPMNT